MQALLIDIEGWEIQMERLLKQIEAYKPCNEQEEKDRELLIQWIRSGMDIVTRANETAHLTASAWVVSPDRKHVLMAYHNIYNSWAWLGGHADGEWNLQKVAIREVEEESGLSQVTPLQEAPASAAFAISVISVTFGVSFIIIGCFAIFLISAVSFSTFFASCPNARNPALTFGHEILISIMSIGSSARRSTTLKYSSGA